MKKVVTESRKRAGSTVFALILSLSVVQSAYSEDVAGFPGDARDNFSVAPYVGIGIDSFAAGSVNQYLNPGESGDVKERFTAGIEFEYRLLKSAEKKSQWWVYGRTTHGVRSTDVDCRANPDNPLCTPFSAELMDPAERGLYILRNASSLEGIGGVRWEFATLNAGEQGSARAYVNGQLGFVAVSDGPDDVAGVHHLGLGAIITQGKYKGSFLEIGYGVNDLILENSDQRLKLNGRVIKKLGSKSRTGLFAHISVDVDGSDGSDSIQTYLGVYYSVGSGNSKLSQ